MNDFFIQKGSDIVINIKAVPNSSKNEFCGLLENALKIKIKAPAVENKANLELIKFLSKELKIPKSSIKLLSGETSKIKKILISDCSIEKLKGTCFN